MVHPSALYLVGPGGDRGRLGQDAVLHVKGDGAGASLSLLGRLRFVTLFRASNTHGRVRVPSVPQDVVVDLGRMRYCM